MDSPPSVTASEGSLAQLPVTLNFLSVSDRTQTVTFSVLLPEQKLPSKLRYLRLPQSFPSNRISTILSLSHNRQYAPTTNRTRSKGAASYVWAGCLRESFTLAPRAAHTISLHALFPSPGVFNMNRFQVESEVLLAPLTSQVEGGNAPLALLTNVQHLVHVIFQQ